MADDFAFTPGAGATGAADDVGGILYQRVKLSAGPDGVAADAAVNVGAAGATVFRVVAANITTKAEDTFNRPANTTAYTANDAIGSSTTAGSVTVMSFAIAGSAGDITRIRVRKSDQTVATPTIRVWLYDSSPIVGAGDNAAFAQPVANCLGYVDVDVTTAGSDDAVGWASCDIPVAAATVYALLQTTSAFTPTSGETFTVSLWYVQG